MRDHDRCVRFRAFASAWILFAYAFFTLNCRAEAEDSKLGYAADGRTSASVLAAARSHQVADEDAVGLSVFSGLIVIGVVAFLLPKLFEK